jgi:hypothetical protein
LNFILQIPVTVTAGPHPFPFRTRELCPLDKLGDKAKSLCAKGLVWIKKQTGWKSSLKMTGALDLMTGSPSPVDRRQLDELGLKLKG